MNLKSHEFVFFDCQSTGASPARGNVLEMAWCKSSAEIEPEKLETFLIKQPEGTTIPYMIQNLTGIVQADMISAVEEATAYSDFLNQFGESRHALIHYARFEQAFLSDLHSRHGKESAAAEFPFKIFCTYEIARRLFPNLPTRGINGIAGYFGAHMPETKRSSCHVTATWSIWKGLTEELAKRGIFTVFELENWLQDVPAAKRTKVEYPLDKSKRIGLPDKPGVYRMLDRTGKILYVGKATSLKSRVNSYFRGKKGKDSKRLEMLTRVSDLKITLCETRLEAAILETDEIKFWNPPYNIALKAGKRQLVYYNRDLTKWQITPDKEHYLGPFASTFLIEPLLRLSVSLSTGEFDPNVFFDHVDPELLAEGYEYFEQSTGFSVSSNQPRALMAGAIRMYRDQIRIIQEEKLLGAEPQEDDGIEAESLNEDSFNSLEDVLENFGVAEQVPDSIKQDEEELLTVEEVGAKFQRLLLRSARFYLQAKALRVLLNCKISFVDTGIERQLQTKNGKFILLNAVDNLLVEGIVAENFENRASTYSDKTIDDKADVELIDLLTFDRMRVLMAELGRINISRSKLEIISSRGSGIPRWLLEPSPLM